MSEAALELFVSDLAIETIELTKREAAVCWRATRRSLAEGEHARCRCGLLHAHARVWRGANVTEVARNTCQCHCIAKFTPFSTPSSPWHRSRSYPRRTRTETTTAPNLHRHHSRHTDTYRIQNKIIRNCSSTSTHEEMPRDAVKPVPICAGCSVKSPESSTASVGNT